MIGLPLQPIRFADSMISKKVLFFETHTVSRYTFFATALGGWCPGARYKWRVQLGDNSTIIPAAKKMLMCCFCLDHQDTDLLARDDECSSASCAANALQLQGRKGIEDTNHVRLAILHLCTGAALSTHVAVDEDPKNNSHLANRQNCWDFLLRRRF